MSDLIAFPKHRIVRKKDAKKKPRAAVQRHSPCLPRMEILASFFPHDDTTDFDRHLKLRMLLNCVCQVAATQLPIDLILPALELQTAIMLNALERVGPLAMAPGVTIDSETLNAFVEERYE